jgi:hypothetical protein
MILNQRKLKEMLCVMKTKNLSAALFLMALLLVLADSPGYAYVLGDIHYYRFDDISGPSGRGAQWVAVTDRMNSVGAAMDGPHSEDIQASGNIVNTRDYIYISNAVNDGIVSADEPIRFIFAALPGFEAAPVVEFAWRNPEAQGGVYDQDVTIWQDAYRVDKKTLSGAADPAKRYQFNLTKTRYTSQYGTERTYMRFHQNPDYTPSQTLQIPLVLANVKDGSAIDEPLLFRAAVRDMNDNIAAYDQFRWAVDGNKEVGGDNDWIFVPVQNEIINSMAVNYRLVTDVRNFCGIRYGLNRYDLLGPDTELSPKKWSMDLPASVKDISSDIRLDELSQIAPGLITTYDQSFDVASGRHNVFTVYAIDPVSHAPRNPFDLTLTHPLIFGVGRGASGGDVYNVTGFQLLPSDTDFPKKAARSLGVKRIAMPSADVVSATAVTGGFVTADAIGTITVSAAMPDGMLRSNDVTGILPLHVTFNLPNRNRFIGPKWDEMVEEFKRSGSVRDLFAEHYSLYSYSSKEKKTDIFKWLRDNGALEKVVKAFVDEERGVVTLSFVVMLLDGNARLRTLRDSSAVSSYSYDYLAMGDGNENDAWDVAFYVAPIESSADGSGSSGDGGSSSGGGGCDTGAASLLLVLTFAVLAALRPRMG